MKLLIAEEALHSLEGHWFEYIRTIVDGCRQAGDQVTVACHRDAIPEVVNTLQALPTFPSSVWDHSRQQGGGGAIRRLWHIFRHNFQLYRAVRRLLREHGPFDRIFVPTILIDHLGAWTLIARSAQSSYGKLILFFINGHGVYRGPDQPVVFPRSPNTLLSRMLLRSLRTQVADGQVVLAVDVEARSAEFTRFCGLPFRCFPHPVKFGDVSAPLPEPAIAKASGGIVLSSLGFARHEKGSDLLQEAIIRVRRERPDLGHVKFVIQWLHDFDLPDGRCCAPDPGLREDAGVEFLARSFEPAEYHAQLARTDGMILPYRAHSYYARVSRVAIEAAMLGIPMVYTRDTWLQELVEQCGAGVSFADGDIDGLTTATLQLIDELPAWKAAAEARADAAHRLQSPERFRACLLAD